MLTKVAGDAAYEEIINNSKNLLHCRHTYVHTYGKPITL